MTFILAAAFIGLLGGIASGLFGVGGGAIFVPLMVFFFKVDPHLAVGTSLAVVIPTALIGVWKHGSAGMIDWKMTLMLTVFAVLGAWLGSVLSLKLDGILLKRLFALFVALIAVKLFFSR